MDIFGNRQNIVTDIKEGAINNLTIQIPRSIVKVGNDIGLVVRVSDKICWITDHYIAKDGTETANLTEMTNTTGSDANVLKYKIDSNVLSFNYATTEGEELNVNVTVAIIYNRNFYCGGKKNE